MLVEQGRDISVQHSYSHYGNLCIYSRKIILVESGLENINSLKMVQG